MKPLATSLVVCVRMVIQRRNENNTVRDSGNDETKSRPVERTGIMVSLKCRIAGLA